MAAPGPVVEAFRNLPSNRARAAALDALLNELSHDEWRLVKAKAASSFFTFDLIGSLPVELVAEILTYLDPATPFRLQCVSKRWHKVLSSPDVLGPSLNMWHPRHERPLQGEAACQGDPYAICRLKARHQHRFRTGKICTYLKMQIPVPTVRNLHSQNFWFQEDTIVWLPHPHGPRELYVYNLRTGEHWEGRNQARHTISKVALSDQLVVFVTSDNTCHARDLSTGLMRTFRLPPAMFACLTCQGRIVAGGGNSEDGIDIFIWDFDTQVCRTLNLQRPMGYIPPNGQKGFQLLPDRNFESITVFSDTALSHSNSEQETKPVEDLWPSMDEEREDDILHFTKFSLSGQKLCAGSLTVFDVQDVDPCDIVPVDRKGRFALKFNANVQGPVHSSTKTFQIGFDQEKNRFLQVVPREPVPDPSLNSYRWAGNGTGDMLCVGAETVWWRDVYYRMNKNSAPAAFCMGSSERGLATLTRLDFDSSETTADQDDACKIFLNEIFLVKFYNGQIEIWVFDEDLRLADPKLSPSLPLLTCYRSWLEGQLRVFGQQYITKVSRVP